MCVSVSAFISKFDLGLVYFIKFLKNTFYVLQSVYFAAT